MIKLEFEINNGDHVIYEYCSELIREVQQAKEEEIERIENLAESLIEQISQYKKETTDKYKNNQDFKVKFAQRLNTLQSASASSFATIENLNFKLKFEHKLVHKSIFDGKFLKFKKFEPSGYESKENYIGNLELDDKNVIDADFNLVNVGQLSISDEAKKELSTRVYHKYFDTGECFLAFHSSTGDTLIFYVLNKDKTVKVTKKGMKSFGLEYRNVFYVVKDKLVYQQEDGRVVIYDNCLNLICKYDNIWRLNPLSDSDIEKDSDGSMTLRQYRYAVNRLETKNFLIGACESGLYFANEEDNNVIEVCDWSLKYLKNINFSDKLLHKFIFWRPYEDRFYFIDESLCLRIVKGSNNISRNIEDVERYEIDPNGNLIVFYCCFNFEVENKKRLIGFFDLDGNHKYDLQLVNISKNLNVDDFEYYDDFLLAFENWIDALTIENSGKRVLTFFNIESFAFQDFASDEFVSTKIADK